VAFEPKPHVSAALRHLRFSVTTAGAALSIALILQMLVFAFVHFTDVRWTELEPAQQPTHELRIIHSNATNANSLSGKGSATKPATSTPARSPAEAETSAAASIDINRVLNRNDRWLHSVSDLSRTIGSIAAIVLMLAILQSVVIAGGAGVPGVEKAVTAGTWSIVLALLCLPVGAMLPGVAFAGALPSYTWLTHASEAIGSGAVDAPPWATFFGSALLAPIIALAATSLITLRFHAAVEQGVVITSVSELDAKLHREMSSIKMAATHAPRSVGALNRAIGDTSDSSVAPAQTPTPDPPMAGPPPIRRIGEPMTGDGLKRPI